jgi:hypothetical protein
MVLICNGNPIKYKKQTSLNVKKNEIFNTLVIDNNVLKIEKKHLDSITYNNVDINKYNKTPTKK